MADLTYETARRLPVDSGGSTMSGRQAIASGNAIAYTTPATAALQRLDAMLNQGPRVQALQRVSAMLSGAPPPGPAVVQRTGGRYELTIPADRSGYAKELRGHDAYRWIVRRHGEAAIQGIKDQATLVFRDGGMFVQAAARDWVVGLLVGLHLNRSVAVGQGARAPEGVADIESEADVESDAEVESEFEYGEEDELAADSESLTRFVLYVPARGQHGLLKGAAAETAISEEDRGDELLETLQAEIQNGELVVYAADIETLQGDLDAVLPEGFVEIWRSVEDIAAELPDYTVDTMKAINAANSVKYPYNFSEDDFAQAEDYFAQVEYQGNLAEAREGFADPRYFDRSSRFTWTLKPNVSAAMAIESFVNLAGRNPVIAECQTTAQAVEYYAILKAVGRRRFDARFGSATAATPARRLLRLQFTLDPSNPIKGLYESPRIGLDEEEQAGVDRDEDGNIVSAPNSRPAKRGGRYFIQGPTGYVKRHPEGFLRGENAFYYGEEEGEQRFGGLGIENETELGITGILADAFNAAPTESEKAKQAGLSQDERNSGLHGDVLPNELIANAQSVATVHRASDLLDLAQSLDDTVVSHRGVNARAKWSFNPETQELVMNRTACLDKFNKDIAGVSLYTVVQDFAKALGLEFSKELVKAVRPLNPGIGNNEQAPEKVPRWTLPNLATLIRLTKGTGFQATNAQILDPQKIHAMFFGQEVGQED